MNAVGGGIARNGMIKQFAVEHEGNFTSQPPTNALARKFFTRTYYYDSQGP